MTQFSQLQPFASILTQRPLPSASEREQDKNTQRLGQGSSRFGCFRSDVQRKEGLVLVEEILKRKITFDLVFEGWVESQKGMAFQMTHRVHVQNVRLLTI